MALHFNELLNGVGSIEMRYFDLQGKLIAKQRLECTVPARERKQLRSTTLLNRKLRVSPKMSCTALVR
jgi:hypothetical protein